MSIARLVKRATLECDDLTRKDFLELAAAYGLCSLGWLSAISWPSSEFLAKLKLLDAVAVTRMPSRELTVGQGISMRVAFNYCC